MTIHISTFVAALLFAAPFLLSGVSAACKYTGWEYEGVPVTIEEDVCQGWCASVADCRGWTIDPSGACGVVQNVGGDACDSSVPVADVVVRGRLADVVITGPVCITTPAFCGHLCDVTNRCRYWSMGDYGCRLLENLSYARGTMLAASGTRRQPTESAAAPACSCFQQDLEYIGTSSPPPLQGISSTETCTQRCEDTVGCTAWTWNADNTCQLLLNVKEKRERTGSFSAFKADCV